MSHALQEASAEQYEELPGEVYLELEVRDPDAIAELVKHRSGPERDQFALDALKIGLLALRRASTRLDADLLQSETRRFLDSLGQQLESHAQASHQRIAASLKEHFDPESGRFSERVKSLTADNGELARLLRNQIDGDDSQLAKTLVAHVGKESPLMKMLAPDQSQGLLATLQQSVHTQLAQQRERLLSEFSLDNAEGALSRLIRELTSKHGDLSKDLQAKIDVVVKEFSLDQENSALSRLVQNVDRAQRTITSEFSLDNEHSALRRLKNELTTLLAAQIKTNAEFQEEVKGSLRELVVKRQEELRSARHGATFQDAVVALLRDDAQRRGDLADDTGNSTGCIKNCKVGDAVLQLGPESAAPGARIVVEAKEDRSYSLAKIHEEIEQARKNRTAQLGIFVYSKRSAPAGMKPLVRYGPDLVIVWDAEDPSSDVYFEAALEIARALCVRARRNEIDRAVDFGPIDRALFEIEKRVGKLDDIHRSAETIKKASESILQNVRIGKQQLSEELNQLADALENVKAATSAEPVV